jgi:hypothetical protein
MQKVILTSSYKKAYESLIKETPIEINDVTIRYFTNNIGEIVFKIDEEEAKKIEILPHINGNNDTQKMGHVVYISLSGSSLHILNLKNEKNNMLDLKLGLIYSSAHIKSYNNGKDIKTVISQKEYIPFLGNTSLFK